MSNVEGLVDSRSFSDRVIWDPQQRNKPEESLSQTYAPRNWNKAQSRNNLCVCSSSRAFPPGFPELGLHASFPTLHPGLTLMVLSFAPTKEGA